MYAASSTLQELTNLSLNEWIDVLDIAWKGVHRKDFDIFVEHAQNGTVFLSLNKSMRDMVSGTQPNMFCTKMSSSIRWALHKGIEVALDEFQLIFIVIGHTCMVMVDKIGSAVIVEGTADLGVGIAE